MNHVVRPQDSRNRPVFPSYDVGDEAVGPGSLFGIDPPPVALFLPSRFWVW